MLLLPVQQSVLSAAGCAAASARNLLHLYMTPGTTSLQQTQTLLLKSSFAGPEQGSAHSLQQRQLSHSINPFKMQSMNRHGQENIQDTTKNIFDWFKSSGKIGGIGGICKSLDLSQGASSTK